MRLSSGGNPRGDAEPIFAEQLGHRSRGSAKPPFDTRGGTVDDAVPPLALFALICLTSHRGNGSQMAAGARAGHLFEQSFFVRTSASALRTCRRVWDKPWDFSLCVKAVRCTNTRSAAHVLFHFIPSKIPWSHSWPKASADECGAITVAPRH